MTSSWGRTAAGRVLWGEAERETLSASLQAPKPLVGEVFTEQDIDDLRHDLASALIELVLGKIGDGVRHGQVLIIRHTPGLSHRPAGGMEDIGDNGRCRDAMLLKQNAVEHTARAARASVSHPSDHHIALGFDVVDDLLVGRHAGAALAPQ
jgi:hypothetical protein